MDATSSEEGCVNTRDRFPAHLGARAGLLVLALIAGSLPRAAGAQSSANFKLAPGVLSAGASSNSANFALTNDFAGTAGNSRVSSGSFDAISGLIGGEFPSTATVTISTTGKTFSSVAFPLTVANNGTATVLGLGGGDITKWRFGRWSPADSAYAEFGATLGVPNITRGLGYWLITKDNATVTYTGLPSRTDQYTITPLVSGPGGRPAWNQLGNPNLYPIPVSLMFVDGGINGIFNVTSGTNVLTSQVVKVRSGTTFVDATVVNGRTAFWIKKLISAPVTLYIPPIASLTGSPEPARSKPAGASWAVAINGLQNGRASETLWLGAAPVPNDGWNTMSISRGPALPEGEDLSLFVPKHDWREMSDDYVRVFEPAKQRMSWDVVVAGAEGPGEMMLTAEGFDLPAGIRLWLSDPQAGWTREVVPGHAVTVAVGTQPKSLRFETSLSGTSLVSVPANDMFRVAYPNPFRLGTGLSFSLARAGDLAVDIFDVQGRKVRSLEARGLAPGEHVMAWDGRDDGGHAIGSGVYLARWRAGTARGVGRLVKID
jgi:hypothetical protein